MTMGKPAGEKAQVPLAFPRSHCSQMPRIHNHMRPLEERKGTEGLKEETVQLHLISTHIESEMLLNEFYHSFPKSKLVVLEKHHFRTDSRRVRGCPFALEPRHHPKAELCLDTSPFIPDLSVTGKALPT